MTFLEPSTAGCLRLLLDDQSASLRQITYRVSGTLGHRMPTLPPSEWCGPARLAYDQLVHRLAAELGESVSWLNEAIRQSERASSTLDSRV